MTKYNSTDIGYLLLGPYDITLVTNALEDSIEGPVEDLTPFSVDSAIYVAPVLKTYKIEGHGGWYDDDAGSINAAAIAAGNDEAVFMFAYQGNEQGKYALCAGGGMAAKYTRGFSAAQVHTAKVDLAVSGPHEEALIVAELASRAGSDDTESTYQDLGAPSASRTITANTAASPSVVTTSVAHGFESGQPVVITGSNSTPSLNGTHTVTVIDATHFSVPVACTVAGSAGTAVMTPGAKGANIYLACTELNLTGSTNLAPELEHSADHVAWVTYSALTPLTDIGAEKKEVATACNRYVAYAQAFTGSAGSPSATCTLAVKAN
jgi:hypothetical protein